MEQVVGVRFQEAGKIYYFTSAGYDDLDVGEYVVVETSRGLELARVVIAPDQVINVELTEPLKPITRLATDEDLQRAEQLKQRAQQDVEAAKRRGRELKLPMKIVSGSFNLDGSKMTLLFTSESRIDFRDLLRDLSQALGVQVQLRQVGPRDQAKVVGGYGRCGRRLCCSSWLLSFPAISIKMAKEQDLPLNPSKISGQCGRLLCCLSYENEMYRQVKQALPRPGSFLSTPTGTARVHSVNVPREIITLQMMETFQYVDVPVQELGLDRGLVRILDRPPVPALSPERAQPSVAAATPHGRNGIAPQTEPVTARTPDAAAANRPREPRRSPERPLRNGPAPLPAERTAATKGQSSPAPEPPHRAERGATRERAAPPAPPAPAGAPAAHHVRRRRRRGGLGPGLKPPQG
jgi:cell fate regulator YaaT (PSP1 superfamily)